MASGTARRDDLADLFTDDLLGMSAGVGNERDEETVREAIGRGISLGDEHQGRGGGSHDDARVTPGRTRDRDGPSQQRGTPGGGRHRDRDDDRGRYMAHNAGAHTISDFLTTSLNAPAGDAPDGDSGDGDGDGDDPDHDHDPDRPDDLDGDDEIEARPWPSPAELLADARELLATADSLVLREGGEAPSAEKMRRLDRELRRIVDSQRTTPEDDQKRQNLLARFDTMLQRKFAGVTLQPFGSFVSVFHTAGSDVDVSLEVSPNSNWYDPREMGPGAVNAAVGGGRGGRNRRQQTPRGYKSRKVQLLSKVASELRYQKFADVNLIAHARVPLIKFRDPRTGVKCDVCVGNDGVYKSAVLGAMADLDSRYRDLVFLIKMWAKNFDCNDATAGSFNSYSLSLMSLFHLQTRSPPILPPAMRLTLQTDAAADADLAAENERAANLEPIRKFPVSKIRQQSDAMRDIAPVERRARRWRGCGANNGATLAELLVTFFTHFRAVEPLWRHGLVASAYAGRWTAGCSWAPGRYCLGVEDPFAAGDNVARAVQRRSLPKVLSALRDGTLAVGRVVWADGDDDLDDALVNLLGPAASRGFAEPPANGWPTLGGGPPGPLNGVNVNAHNDFPGLPGAPPNVGINVGTGAPAGVQRGNDLMSLLSRGAPMSGPPMMPMAGPPPGLQGNLGGIFGGGAPMGGPAAGPGSMGPGGGSMAHNPRGMAAPPPGFGIQNPLQNPFDRMPQQPGPGGPQFPPPSQQLGPGGARGHAGPPPGLDCVFRQLSFGAGGPNGPTHNAQPMGNSTAPNPFDGQNASTLNNNQLNQLNDGLGAHPNGGGLALGVRQPQPGDGAYVSAGDGGGGGGGGVKGDRGGRRSRGRGGGGNGGGGNGGGKGVKGKGAAPPAPVSTGPKTLPKPRAVPPKA